MRKCWKMQIKGKTNEKIKQERCMIDEHINQWMSACLVDKVLKVVSNTDRIFLPQCPKWHSIHQKEEKKSNIINLVSKVTTLIEDCKRFLDCSMCKRTVSIKKNYSYHSYYNDALR